MAHNPFKIELAELSDTYLDGKYKKAWIEEAVDIDNGNQKLSISHTRTYLGTSIDWRKIIIFLGIIFLGMGAICARIFYLQIIKGEYYHSLAEGNRIRLQPIPAERGVVFDRFNKILVHNIPGFSLVLSPQDLPADQEKRKEIIRAVATMSGISETEIQQLLKKYGNYSETITLKENVDYNTALQLYIINADLPGVKIESGSKRHYGLSITSTADSLLSMSHLIGYMGKLNDEELTVLHNNGYLLSDKIGRTGIEKMYEPYLRGTYGRKKIEVNAVGREQDVLAMTSPEPGKNLVLTIDIEAQQVLEKLVKNTAEKTNQRKIAAIAMNPNNGEVLALVSWPSFDNNKFSQGIDQATFQSYINDKDLPLFNRAIGGGYPPRSTAKLMIAAAALQEKIITRYTSVNSVGGISVGGTIFKDWQAGGHGITNVTKALAWSVNTFFYYVGGGYEKFTGLGIDTIVDYLSAFNLGQKTNIDLAGENPGFIPSKEWKKNKKNEAWFVGDTYNVSIGQGDLLVSPLQSALWTAIVANNGIIVTPHIGKAVIDPVSKITTELEYPSKRLQQVSADNLAIVREGMRDCVTIGSCKLLQSLPFSTGAKTGTAQWSKNRPTHAWFTSFAPYVNPQIVVTVLVEEGGQGSIVSMPVARDFLAWWGKKYRP